MKTALITFLSNNTDCTSDYLSLFSTGGYEINKIVCISDKDEDFRKEFNALKDEQDLIVILDNNSVKTNYKQIISKEFDSPQELNDSAQNLLKAIAIAGGIEYKKEDAVLIKGSVFVPNLVGAKQGFYFDSGKTIVAVMPTKIEELSTMCEKYLFPYLDEKNKISIRHITLKYFGKEEKMLNVLKEASNNFEREFNYSYSVLYGDITLRLVITTKNENNGSEVIRFIFNGLKEDIYAEEDVSLSHRLFDLLKLKKQRIAFAESFTGGRLVSEMVGYSGASNIVKEGIVAYSNESKVNRLNVKKEDLIKEGAVSNIVAYEMALNLIKGGVDIAVATTGLAGPNGDGTGKPVGLCYIAVGMNDGIHTHKLMLKGNREEITETAKNYALFLAIKKLKNKQ